MGRGGIIAGSGRCDERTVPWSWKKRRQSPRIAALYLPVLFKSTILLYSASINCLCSVGEYPTNAKFTNRIQYD